MNRYNFLCLLYVTCGSIFYGYDSGCTTSILGYPAFIEYYKLDSILIGAFGSAYYGGAVLGMASNWFLPDRIGRLRSIQIACVLGIIGISMQTGASSFAVFCTGRIIGGYASGVIFSLCPTYASEISPPEWRGRVGGIFSIMVNASYMVTEWIGLGLSFVHGDSAWRLLLGLQLVPSVGMLVGSFWMPFSPRWLALKGRYEECCDVLKKMHGSGHDDDFYLQEYHQVRAQIEFEKEEKLGLRTIIRRPSYRKRIYLVVALGFFMMMSGIIAIQNYQVIMYNNLGMTNTMALTLTAVWGTVGTFSAVMTTFFFDKLGRKPVIYISYGLQITGCLLVVTLWARYEAGHSSNAAMGKGVIGVMYLVCLGYSGPMNAFIATYPAEIMPTCIRSAGVATAYVVMHCIMIVIVQITPLALEVISWRFFLIFLIANAIFVVILYLFYPETKGKTLEEMSALFGDEVAETLEEAGMHVKDEKQQTQHIEMSIS
ncbi:MFS transporter [Eremomyces bilateralis CBS 781.70]|uniref:MFS transporter n=1 Tax=Eremomyces bilateralis CBS 781.70 TaxID=1392243 RepID=A0A6G1GGE2_9PEZI|nr:MFS transporter [Eremomyces bilateralis CBS 781.70]KAF1816930.1 MFS transporter [Eremomyces bilateralis CBS 781.70]